MQYDWTLPSQQTTCLRLQDASRHHVHLVVHDEHQTIVSYVVDSCLPNCSSSFDNLLCSGQSMTVVWLVLPTWAIVLPLLLKVPRPSPLMLNLRVLCLLWTSSTASLTGCSSSSTFVSSTSIRVRLEHLTITHLFFAAFTWFYSTNSIDLGWRRMGDFLLYKWLSGAIWIVVRGCLGILALSRPYRRWHLSTWGNCIGPWSWGLVGHGHISLLNVVEL